MIRCGETFEIDEVVDEVMRDEAFNLNSGGGVRLSGGEPLLHIEFATRLLDVLKAKGSHTTVDTSGHVRWSSIESTYSVVDSELLSQGQAFEDPRTLARMPD